MTPPSIPTPLVAAHTPGPWAIEGEDSGFDGVDFIEISAGECGTSSFKEVAHVQSTFDGDAEWELTEEDRANARLIAAAPELLAALRTARIALIAVADSALEAGFDQLADIIDEQLAKANSAIAKAEGQPS